ncbi:MAG: ABC transporter permease [Thermoanaerobacteraceae bacterium]|nr:ABC transporter permease [Thermoanaerobacteraceae bacterium]
MSVLARKILRTIWSTRGPFLAVVAVVVIGVSVYISMTTAFYNLNRSKEVFYRENNFADYYFHVVKAPQEIIKQIEAIPGVIKATGRIQKYLPVIQESNKRATARLISYPLPMENEVNRLTLLSGRLFEKYPQNGNIEILVDPQFARANNLAPNDTVTVVAEGKRVSLTVVGTGTSPEFVYPMKDAASLMPEPDSFGIIMIPHNQAQQILNLPGQINQVVLRLAPGIDTEELAEQVKKILEPYGNLADYAREKQLSHAVLQAELDGLKTTSKILPLIFFVIAAAIQFIMLGRMVKKQRLQIGVLKALGYSNRQIIIHYTGYALVVSIMGALLGTLLGLYFASIISKAYAQFFNLPEAISGVNIQAILYGFILSMSVGIVAGLTAFRKIVSISPAESMRPEPPKSSRKILLENLPWLWNKLSPSWKMSLRTAGRNRVRFGITMVGVVFAVGLLIIAFFADDSINYMLKKHFHQEQRYDYLIRFTSPLKEHELLNITRLKGVLKAEPFLEIPVKVHFKGRTEEDLLVGLPLNVTLKKLHSEKDYPLQLPENGLLINKQTADKLGIRVGDIVEVETLLGIGPSRRACLKVVGINQQVIGGGSYIALDQANRVLKEKQLISGAMLKVDPGKAGQIEEELNKMTGISSVISRQKELNNFHQNLDSLIYFTAIMIIFAVVLGFAIVYNALVISFSERQRELASLRVMGFTAKEVSGLLLKENLLQSSLGLVIGLPFGFVMAREYVRAISNDIYTLPVVIYPKTYILSALGGILFMMVAHLVAAKGIKKMNPADILKDRE